MENRVKISMAHPFSIWKWFSNKEKQAINKIRGQWTLLSLNSWKLYNYPPELYLWFQPRPGPESWFILLLLKFKFTSSTGAGWSLFSDPSGRLILSPNPLETKKQDQDRAGTFIVGWFPKQSCPYSKDSFSPCLPCRRKLLSHCLIQSLKSIKSKARNRNEIPSLNLCSVGCVHNSSNTIKYKCLSGGGHETGTIEARVLLEGDTFCRKLLGTVMSYDTRGLPTRSLDEGMLSHRASLPVSLWAPPCL